MIWPLETPIVIYDLETTSSMPENARVVQTAGLIIDTDGEIVDEFNELSNPGISIPKPASAVHGITDNDVKGCLSSSAILEGFLEWVNGYPTTAYNLPYDRAVINHELVRYSLDVPEHLRPSWNFDTYALVKRLLNHKVNELPNYKLTSIAEYFGKSSDNAHDALADVKMTYEVLKDLFVMFAKNKPGTDFRTWYDTPTYLYWCPVGMHKGMKLENVEKGWLYWALDKMGGDLLYSIKHVLNVKYGES